MMRRMMCGLVMGWTAIAAGSVALTPTADTMVSAKQPDGSFGAAGAVAVSAVGLSNKEYQSLFKFNAAAAKTAFDGQYGVSGWTLSGATLTLTAANPGNPNFNTPNHAGSFLVTWTASDAWIEGAGNPNSPGSDGITFNTLSTIENGALDRSLGAQNFPGGTSGATPYTLLLDPSFIADIQAGGDVTLRLSANDSAVTFVVNASNFGSNFPTLTLSATPLPEPALGLLVPVLAGLIRRRNRR